MRLSQLTLLSRLVCVYGLSVRVPSPSPVSKGMVAFGLIPSDARDSTGATIGGVGSAIALKRGVFERHHDGSFSGTLVIQPDRGYNVDGTVDYEGRQHEYKFVMKPYQGSNNLSFSAAQNTFSLKYQKTLLYTERQGKSTTGLDALDARPATFKDPPLPIPSLATENHLSLDCEGLVLNEDGSFFVGDEYGAYIYRFLGNGHLDYVIQPPQAVVPYLNGRVNFTSVTNPNTGRTPNQGFEGLTAAPNGKKLYALLQTATIQDGGSGNNNRYTRLFEWDVGGPKTKLTGEWVVPLPESSKGKAYGQSEIHYLDGYQFLILARDGHGHGDTTTLSAYKSIDIFDISAATNIVGTSYDLPSNSVSPNGVLVSGITPATYTPFLSIIDSTQLARFGLHNGGTSDPTLIDAKWESIALAPALDPQNPDDYFIFTMADNDFNTLNGYLGDGTAYSTSFGENVDTQLMVYRATLPMVKRGSVERAIGI